MGGTEGGAGSGAEYGAEDGKGDGRVVKGRACEAGGRGIGSLVPVGDESPI